MTRISELPAARDVWPEIERAAAGRSLAVFLDFDGTLAPIVDDPAAAVLPAGTRERMASLASHCTVVVVSGRDADDVRARVDLDGLVYAGSHGFDVIWPSGHRTERGGEFAEQLRRAAGRLREELADVAGTEVEAKRFAVAVHHRRTPPQHLATVEATVAHVAEEVGGLRRSGGKQVLELRPDLDWDKGHTVRWLLAELGLDGPGTLPVYLGDDLTDEDAFAALAEHGHGLGIVVRGEDDERDTAAQLALADVTETSGMLDALTRLAAHGTAN